MDRKSVYWAVLLALLIGMATSLAGVTLDRMLHQHRPLFASDLLEGVAATLLSAAALLRADARRRDSLHRMQAIEDVNHHVRNALTAVTYSALLHDDPVLDAIVRDANERVDWTLREVLPRTVRPGENLPETEGRWQAGLQTDSSPLYQSDGKRD